MAWVSDCYICTHTGCGRSSNEDNFFANGLTVPKEKHRRGLRRFIMSEEATQLYAVCDGMGGQAGGALASALAVDMLRPLLSNFARWESIELAINDYTQKANQAVCALPGGQAGTTLTLAHLQRGSLTIAHLGDSRAYLMRKGKLEQLTQDHTEAARLKSLGVTPPLSGRESALTRYLGLTLPGLVLAPSYHGPLRLRQGDCLLLCSDGLYQALSAKKMERILKRAIRSPAYSLVRAALKAKAQDNITAMVIDVWKRRK